QNVGAGVVGLVIWPVWFGMDFKDAAGKEAAALEARQKYLTVLATQRCTAPPPAARQASAPHQKTARAPTRAPVPTPPPAAAAAAEEPEPVAPPTPEVPH
ncbi:MAG TPA: hypothetical protein VHT68_23405, partial [Pseudolabrys sp.]|nr:hypothetical protein [Pseudolabrys sp.]